MNLKLTVGHHLYSLTEYIISNLLRIEASLTATLPPTAGRHDVRHVQGETEAEQGAAGRADRQHQPGRTAGAAPAVGVGGATEGGAGRRTHRQRHAAGGYTQWTGGDVGRWGWSGGVSGPLRGVLTCVYVYYRSL